MGAAVKAHTILLGFLLSCDVTPEPIPPEPPPAARVAPAKSGPPCIHEACADRPRFLQCTDQRTGYREYSCIRFEVLYEMHCVCDQWGTP